MSRILIAALTFYPMWGQCADIVALCIGNDAYVNANDVLDTPVADATLMKTTLEALPGGADVELLTDASREETVIALNSLVARSRGAKLVLVFYSGHGLDGQPEGFARPDTFLLPVEAVIPDVSYLPTRAVGVQTILETLGKCPVTARAVILDCCRTGAPKATAALKGSTKSFGDIDQSVKDSLGAAVVPEATLVAFASGPLRKAAAFLKQSDTNSPFTLFIAESLATGSGNLRDLIEAAAEKTELATERRQVPQVHYTGAASAIRQIVFRESAASAGTSAEMEALKAQLAAEKKAREEAEARATVASGGKWPRDANALFSKVEKMVAERMGVNGAPTNTNGPNAEVASSPRPASVEFVDPVPEGGISEGPSMGGTSAGERPFKLVFVDPVPEGGFPAPRGMEGSRAGEVKTFGGIEMVWCPPGEFLMGSPEGEEERSDDETQHRVTLTKGFWLAKTECTQGQWESAMGSNASAFKGVNLPVENVSWEDAQRWLLKMDERGPLPSGWRWTLPTEAQWEYACRAGTEMAFSGNLDEMAWYSENSEVKTNSVGTKKANAWGLHDMHGNVLEWCHDFYGEYATGTMIDPAGSMSGSKRIFRGGSKSDYARRCRSASRDWGLPGDRFSFLGFRPAIVPAGR